MFVIINGKLVIDDEECNTDDLKKMLRSVVATKAH